jgi:diguanylate cyclase (GGDEF)-like protein
LAKLGLQPNQVVGLSIFDVYHDYPVIIEAIKNALAGHFQRNEHNVQDIVFDVFYSPVFDQHGKVIQVIGVANDITERKLAEIDLQYMKASLQSANNDLKAILAREQQLARTDALTGVYNRRHLYELAQHEFEIAARYHQPLSILMFDIDHFKHVNDTFGHALGDQILQLVTQIARAELRSADVIGRYGGEEFVIVLPMTNAQQAYPLAERIRAGVAALRVPTEKGDAIVTLSIGIVEMAHGVQTKTAEELIRFSDKAMYAAKQAGRNRTEIGE